MPIQGTAADLMKLAMIRVDRRLRAEGLEARLVLQVHDELIVECPDGEVAVSYTHLDVYKRQDRHRARLSGRRQRVF